ncbi:MAG: helix-turn-helix protein [Frankiales bacterium]|nr:helix-turn-helix protein [Frankiales bacterium]
MTSRRRKDAAAHQPRTGSQGRPRTATGSAPRAATPVPVPKPRTNPGADAAPPVQGPVAPAPVAPGPVPGPAVPIPPWPSATPGAAAADAGPAGADVPPPSPPVAAAPGVPDWVRALTTARLSAGASVEQVSARTRVRPAVLRDLEAGQLSSSGGHVYARGHLRSVAQALGVDPEVLLAPFDAEVGAPAPVLDPPHLGVERVGGLHVPVAAPERHAPRWGAALVAALAVLAGLLVVGVLRSSSRTPTVADRLPSPAPVAATVRPVVPPVVRPTAAPVAGARLRLRVVDGSSWVRVAGPKGLVFEGVLAAGSSPKDFADARELTLLAGNAGALAVGCAGRDLVPAGRTGAVRRFTCGPKGLVPA